EGSNTMDRTSGNNAFESNGKFESGYLSVQQSLSHQSMNDETGTNDDDVEIREIQNLPGARWQRRSQSGSQNRIFNALLVEDDPDDVLLLRHALMRAGATYLRLVPVRSIEEALLCLGVAASPDMTGTLNAKGIEDSDSVTRKVSAFDVILLDLWLPDSLGL